MTGHQIKIGKNIRIKDGKIVVVRHFSDASAAIRAEKSKRQRVVRPTIKGG